MPPSPSRALQRDSFTLTLGDGREVEVARVRDPRARRIKLSVDERGARLTLPARASPATAERFAVAHRDWLAAQLLRFAPADAAPPFAQGDPGPLPLRGRAHPVRWVTARYVGVTLAEDGALVVAAPEQAREATLRRALLEFYRAQARADVGRWLPRYLDGLPRPPRVVSFKVLSSLWGSLSPSGAVSLDLALVLGPPDAFEYVLVHELCHLIHADHSPRFWLEVERRCPDWRRHRAWFREHGAGLKAGLRRLVG
ncbi:M48 family metallopeptidase [Coralloluteibacterium thermophilus]|uniref:M48 family metallopeptidase n=1 Tax=Coralloluteibacterium thermophilum TaxID=2707049 RepID=A0ABV9NK37_9GAMM